VSRAWPLIRRHGPTVFGLALLVGAVYVVQREFRGLSVADIGAALRAIPPSSLWIAAGWTVLAYLVLTIYDRLGSVYAGHPVTYSRTSLASFCAYTLAHNLGFAAVSGAAVRYRFYAAWGLSPLEIAKVVAFTSLTFGLGGFALGGAVLLFEPEVVPWFGENTSRWVMRGLGLLLWAIVIAYVTLARYVPRLRLFGHQIDLPGFRMAIAQTALASVDVAVTAAIFYTLLPPTEGLTFLKFLGVYVAAYTAGLLAHVPGGIGVFDGTMLLGLQPYLPTAQVVGALLLFRLYYYIVPLFVAGSLFAAFELSQRRAAMAKLTAAVGGGAPFEVPALASLVGLGGTVLLFLGALPTRGSDLEAWGGHVAALVSHFAASVVGSLLLVVGYGLMRRLRIAWLAALALLLNGALIAWLRVETWWLWAAFLLVAVLLASVRGAFYRDARLVAEPLSAETLVALVAVAGCAITLALVAYGGRVAGESWWSVVLSPLAPDTLRFTVGLAAVLMLVAAFRLLRPARFSAQPYDAETRQRLAALGALAPAEADGAVFGDGGRAGVAFVKHEGVWLGLGDPMGGELKDRISAIWRFRDICDRAGVDPAFWRVTQGLLRVYGDIGLTAFPILTPEVKGLRYLACRAERDLERLRTLLPNGAAATAAPASTAASGRAAAAAE
jgi:phosphatidylglycerol lysyltransferase